MKEIYSLKSGHYKLFEISPNWLFLINGHNISHKIYKGYHFCSGYHKHDFKFWTGWYDNPCLYCSEFTPKELEYYIKLVEIANTGTSKPDSICQPTRYPPEKKNNFIYNIRNVF